MRYLLLAGTLAAAPLSGQDEITARTAGCTGGSGPDCARLAELVMRGIETGADAARGRAAGAARLRSRHPRRLHACSAGGWCGGLYLDQDPGRALTLFRRACEAGDAGGCDEASRAYEDGLGAIANRRPRQQLRRPRLRAGRPACLPQARRPVRAGGGDVHQRGPGSRALHPGLRPRRGQQLRPAGPALRGWPGGVAERRPCGSVLSPGVRGGQQRGLPPPPAAPERHGHRAALIRAGSPWVRTAGPPPHQSDPPWRRDPGNAPSFLRGP